MAYSTVDDLLTGDTRIDGVIDTNAFVNAAADEMDSALGFIYETPIVLADTPINRPTSLLLKLINNYLATGRIILTISRSAEDNSLDALGKYYVNTALNRLNMIVEGKISLVGATRIQDESTPKGPEIFNAEPDSLVDMFYGNFNPSNPGYYSGYPYAPRPGVTF